MMFVSNGKKSWIRQTIECKIKRNGSFIDIFYKKNGKNKWLAISEDDLKRLIATPGHGAEDIALIEFDERIK